MIFEPVTPQNAEKLRPYYINCNYRLCEYSVGVKLMWGVCCTRPSVRRQIASSSAIRLTAAISLISLCPGRRGMWTRL